MAKLLFARRTLHCIIGVRGTDRRDHRTLHSGAHLTGLRDIRPLRVMTYSDVGCHRRRGCRLLALGLRDFDVAEDRGHLQPPLPAAASAGSSIYLWWGIPIVSIFLVGHWVSRTLFRRLWGSLESWPTSWESSLADVSGSNATGPIVDWDMLQEDSKVDASLGMYTNLPLAAVLRLSRCFFAKSLVFLKAPAPSCDCCGSQLSPTSQVGSWDIHERLQDHLMGLDEWYKFWDCRCDKSR